MDPIQNQPAETNTSSHKTLIFIIVALLVVIGAFFVFTHKAKAPVVQNDAQTVVPVSTSDEVSAIAADLDGTDLNIDLSGIDSI